MTKKLTPQEKKNRKPAVRANIAHGCQDIVRKRVKYLTGEGVPGAVSNKQSTPRKKLKTGPMSTSVSPMDSVKSELTTPVESSNHFPPPMSSSVDALPTTQHSAIEIPPNDQPISDILEVPPLFDSSHMISSEAPETNITLTTQNLITPDPLLFHTNTVSNTTTDVLNKLLNDNYETESILSANNSNGDHLLGMAHTLSGHLSNGQQFQSNYLNEEYMMLGDIILQSKQASPSPSNTSTSENNTNTLSPSSFGYILNINFEDFNQPKRKVVQKLKDSRPFISLGFTADLAPHDNNNNTDYYDDKMTNNITGKTEEGPGNPIINYNTKFTTDYVPPSITNNLYKTASDLYSKELKNFYYPLSYHALTKLLKVIFGGNDLSPEEK
ncbi:ZCF23, partial [Candida africana]